MNILRVIALFLPVTGLFGLNLELSKLIRETYHQSHSETVYFIDVDQQFYTEFLTQQPDIPLVTFTSANDYFKMFSNESSTAVVVVKTSNFNLHIQTVLPRVIQTLRVRKFVIVSAENLQDLSQYCTYFLENKFTSIYGVVGNFSYAYLNFASKPLQKISPNRPLPDAMRDLNGFTLRTTIVKDFPRVFWYPDKYGKIQIGGCFGRLMVHFLLKHNATFRDTLTSNSTSAVSMPKVINAIKNNELDISINVWGPTVGLDWSYPVRYQSYTIMVPLNGNLDPNEYFVRPFSMVVWILIGLTLAYIVLMDVAKDIVCCRSSMDVWNSFSRTVLALLNCSNAAPIRDYRFHGQVLLLAFVISNVYVIHFTSFLTVYIQIKQYNTKKDLVEHNIPVMIPAFEWQIVKSPAQTAIGLDKIIYPVDYPVYTSNINSMSNTQYAYAIGEDRAKFLINLQKVFSKPLFHTTRDELFTSQLGYLMGRHSRFKEILDEFIHRISDTGLMAKWESEAVSQALRAGFKIDVNREAGVQPIHSPLTLNHLQFAWNCLIIGLTTSFVAFLWEKFGENLIRYFKVKVNKKGWMDSG